MTISLSTQGLNLLLANLLGKFFEQLDTLAEIAWLGHQNLFHFPLKSKITSASSQ